MAAIIILNLKNNQKINEFVSNLDPQFQNYKFNKIADNPLIYFSESATTTQLNKIVKIIKSNPDYRFCVQKCYSNVLKVV